MLSYSSIGQKTYTDFTGLKSVSVGLYFFLEPLADNPFSCFFQIRCEAHYLVHGPPPLFKASLQWIESFPYCIDISQTILL